MNNFGSYLRAFGQFWYNFIIGDDWTLAAAAFVGILVDLGGHYAFGYDADWYILPVIVLGALTVSVWRNPQSD